MKRKQWLIMSDVEGLEFFATHANGHFASAACGLQYN